MMEDKPEEESGSVEKYLKEEKVILCDGCGKKNKTNLQRKKRMGLPEQGKIWTSNCDATDQFLYREQS